MRKTLRTIAATLLVALLLAQQLPLTSVALATEVSPAGEETSLPNETSSQALGEPTNDESAQGEGKPTTGAEKAVTTEQATKVEGSTAEESESNESDGSVSSEENQLPVSLLAAPPNRGPNGNAYAVFDSSTRALTFIRSYENVADGPNQTITDINGSSHTGYVWGGIESIEATCAEDVPWHEYADPYYGYQSVSVADGCTVSPASCAWWFYGAWHLTSVSLTGLETSGTTSFAHMFDGCSNLQDLDATPLDTSSATSTAYMFNYCRYLRTLDLSGFDTSNVTDMSHMFCQCEHIAPLDLSSWDTSSATDMSYLFALCKEMTSLDITGWDTSHVTNMDHMFSGCNTLAHVPTETLNTSSCTNMSGMFGGCWVVESLDLSGFVTSHVTDMNNMFTSCQALTSLDLSSFDTTSVANLSLMFQNCESLRNLDLSSFDTSDATTAETMFTRCTALREVTLGENFCFLPDDTQHNYLPSLRADDTYTGNWVNRDDESQFFDAVWLAMQYDGSTMAGTWVWEEWHDCALTIDLDGGSAPEGAQYPNSYRIGTGVELPGTSGSDLAAPTKSGCTFQYWVDEDGDYVEMIDANSRGPRTVTAKWYTKQIRMRVPVAATLVASSQQDGSLSLAAEGGDFSLSVDNLCPYAVTAMASAEHANGFAIADPGGTLGDKEAEVWLTPVTTGSNPTAEDYDPTTDPEYAEHTEIRLSNLGDGAQVGPNIGPYKRLWLNKVGGAMGGWSTNDGSKALFAQIHWTFSLADGG